MTKAGDLFQLRRMMQTNGYQPLPAHGKRVFLEEWSTKTDVPQGEIAAWSANHPQWSNTGALARDTPAIDLDIKHVEAAQAAEEVIREWYDGEGEVLTRFGEAPKRLIPFQTTQPFNKIRVGFTAPDGSSHAIEVLGDGQQYIVAGIHPGIKRPYSWHANRTPWTVPRSELPEIDAAEAHALIDKIAETLQEQFGFQRAQANGDGTQAANGGTQGKEPIDVGARLETMRYKGGGDTDIHATQLHCTASLLRTGVSLTETVAEVLEATQRAVVNDVRAANWDWERERRDIEDMCLSHINKNPELAYLLPDTPGDSAAKGTADNTATAATAGTKPVPRLSFIDMTAWDIEPAPEQDWVVCNRIPRRECVLFSGEGGAGKSIGQLHLTVATVLACDWLGIIPNQGPGIFIDAEDDEKVLQRRLKAISDHCGATITEMIQGGLRLASWRGFDATLAVVTRSGKVEPTRLYHSLFETAGDIEPGMIGIAASANVFAGNENDRGQVQQFVALLTRVAMVANGAVVLISHPSLTGISTESGLSGTTQWHNSVRARFFLRSVKPEAGEPLDTDLRELVFKKNNYGPVSESILLKWTDGLFLPVDGTSIDEATRDAQAQDVFLTLLKRFRSQNRNVSDKISVNYAPALFAREDEAKSLSLSSKNLERAMRQLFKRNAIWNEPWGRPSRPSFRIAPK